MLSSSYGRTLILAFLFVMGSLLLPSKAYAATLTVTTTADEDNGGTGNGQCSLREAIENANNNNAANVDCVGGTAGSADIITFNIAGAGLQTIAPTFLLPNITDEIIIDGTTQPGATCIDNLLIVLDGNAVASNGLSLLGAGSNGSTIRGLIIQRFQANGIEIFESHNHVIECNLIGTDSSGLLDQGNGGNGVYIRDGSGTRIGTNGDGANDQAERNVISGNNLSGIALESVNTPGATTTNLIAGNYIGLGIDGSTSLGNSSYGITLGNAINNIIGTNGTGNASDLNERNIIASNSSDGIYLSNNSNGNRIAGNYIGTDVTGLQNRGNGCNGIRLQGSINNIIGTNSDSLSDARERNVVSGNGCIGINLIGTGSNANVIAGNIAGLGADGLTVISNFRDGIAIDLNCTNNRIGTDGNGLSDVEERNILSGNRESGLALFGAGNVAAGNYMGVAADGSTPAPNRHGVFVINSNNLIGGDTLIEGNLITGNQQLGIVMPSNVTGNRIQRNSIFNNGRLGIDFWWDNVTLNDPGDGDLGPNRLQNYPVLTAAYNGTNTVITYTLDSTPGTYTVEFFTNTACDPLNHGEGQTFQLEQVITLPGGPFTATLPGNFLNQFITATATNNATLDTSEFSRCRQPGAFVELTAATGAGNEGNAGSTAVIAPQLSVGGGILSIDTTVTLTLTPGSASLISDYTQTSTTITIPGGNYVTPQSFAIPLTALGIMGDTTIEPDETLTLTLTAATAPLLIGDANADGVTQNSTVYTILNDDSVTISFAAATESIDENAGADSAGEIVLTPPVDGITGIFSVTVSYSANPGEATGGTDYNGDLVGTFDCTVTCTTPQSLRVIDILQDTDLEGDEAVTLTLSTPTGGATLGTTTGQLLVITDDDSTSIGFATPTASFSEAAGADSAGTIILTPSAGGVTGTFSVNITYGAGEATSGVDYVGDLTVVFDCTAVCTTPQSINVVDIVQDNALENPETFTLTLSAPSGGVLLGFINSQIITILDDDAIAPTPAPAPAEAAAPAPTFRDTDFIIKQVDKTLAQIGDTLLYTIIFTNPKGNTLNNVVISDTLDSRLDNVQIVSTSAGTGIINGNSVLLRDFALLPAQRVTLVISARISQRTQPGDTLLNTATLESPDASIHVSNTTTTVILPAALPATGQSPWFYSLWLWGGLIVVAAILLRWRLLVAHPF